MKGILFKEEMFRAVVEGRKTKTRRIIKIDPSARLIGKGITGFTTFEIRGQGCPGIYPKYERGEIVYLKEPYILIKKYPCAVDENSIILKAEYKYDKQTHVQKIIPWKNKLFMPEKYARYFIRILNVRVERLQEITEEDAISEGVFIHPVYPSPRMEFASLWDKINQKNNWNTNPWVWVIEFERVIL
jgi:hypothetical protein